MALEKSQQTHKPGLFKQINKPHKHGRHRSKRSISLEGRGKVGVKDFIKKRKKEMTREQRKQQANQLRKNKRQDALEKKRGITDAPLLVCVLPLNQLINTDATLNLLMNCDAEAIVNKSPTDIRHVNIPRFRKRYALVSPPLDNDVFILDILKTCDTVLFVVSANAGIGFGSELVDSWGRNLLTSILAQGLPTPVVAVTDLDSLPIKKQNEQKQIIQKMVSKVLPEEKIMCLTKDSDALNVLRRIGDQKQRKLLYRDRRPNIIAESYEYLPDGANGVLKVTGYLRGTPLSVNGLVYIPGLGAFQMSQIDAPTDPNQIGNSLESENVIRLLDKADPNKQESLECENIPNPLDAEQTWPTEEEIKMSMEENKKVKKVPKGWSEYQAAWILDEDPDEVNDSNESESEDDDAMEAQDEEPEPENDDQFDNITESEVGVNDQQYDLETDLQKEERELEKLKEAQMDQMFPDEVDTPKDIPARERFRKYRGLESFRTSPWDPKENLPLDYARIFQFKNFDHTRRRIMKQLADKEGALPGWYITVHVKGISHDLWKSFQSVLPPITLFGLFPHENKMSVMNVVLKRTSNYEDAIKSKERLIIQCGHRRFIVNPIFSQHTNGKKFKFERFFQPDSIVAASFYAPIQFPPAPILCYKEVNGKLILVATGNLLSCNPDRIIVKRIVLSGHPIKYYNRTIIVRFMFFNREDITYYKPCQLRSKYGRVGHIKEPVGTHGHMKCIFDGSLKSQDTILLYLYKRVFPKWTYEECTVRYNMSEDNMET